jgi:hypothetical protein
MDEPTTIDEFAERYSMEVGAVILSVIKYLVDDPTVIHPTVRRTLLTTTDQEIEEALETIADDLNSTGNMEAIR